jgi:predicted nucleotidyltransferase
MTSELECAVELAAAYLRKEGAAEVWLFGSQVTGRATPQSDVDLVVVGLSLDLYTEVASVVRSIVGVPLDMIWMSERQFRDIFTDAGRPVRRLA